MKAMINKKYLSPGQLLEKRYLEKIVRDKTNGRVNLRFDEEGIGRYRDAKTDEIISNKQCMKIIDEEGVSNEILDGISLKDLDFYIHELALNR